MNVEEFESYVYYGSNEWLRDFRIFLDKVIEERKAHKYELFFRIYYENEEQHEHRHICYMIDTTGIKTNTKKLFNIAQPYKELKVFLRTMEDNYTIMIAKRKYGESLELTENFFKMP